MEGKARAPAALEHDVYWTNFAGESNRVRGLLRPQVKDWRTYSFLFRVCSLDKKLHLILVGT